jgi:FecR protein
MRSARLAFISILFLSAIVPRTAWSQNPLPARPGSINYVEGQAAIGSDTLSATSIGSVELGKDQILTTQAGKVEILLTSGVFLRVADNSSVKMVSPELANTEVELDKGRALIEVIDIHKENNIRVDQNGATVRLLKNGLYEFDADHSQIRVFKGEAQVRAGNQEVKLKNKRMVAITTGGPLKGQGFESRQYEDDFYRWSALRSGYLSEASIDAARIYVGPGPGWYGPGWIGLGWYWNPWYGVYTFLPADRIFWSPFGWRFYSPIFVYRSPYFYGPHFPHRFGEFHGPYGHGYGAPGRRFRR